MIFYIILFLIILAIIIWGGVTQWRFVNGKGKEGFKKYNVDLITYADDESIRDARRGTSYVETQKKMVKFFKDFFPQIQKFHIFGIKDKKSSTFYKNNPKLFDSKIIVNSDPKRKLGVYIFKTFYLPHKVLKTQIKDNDFLLWHDANPSGWDKYFNKKHTPYLLNKHIDKCIKNKGVLVWTHKNSRPINKTGMTSPELIKDLKATHLADAPMTCCSWILLQKTDHVLDLWERILNYATSDRFLTLRNPKYHDNDQDILDIFLKKEGMNINALAHGRGEKSKIILDSFPDP